MQAAMTPFAIHEDGPNLMSTKKLGGLGGVGGKQQPGTGLKKLQFMDGTPQKGGLGMAPKSNRKALSTVSMSQVNARTPGPAGQASASLTNGGKSGSKMMNDSSSVKKSSVKFAIASDVAVAVVVVKAPEEKAESDVPSIDEFVCTRMAQDEDLFDRTARRASKMKIEISAAGLETSSFDKRFDEYQFGDGITASEGGEGEGEDPFNLLYSFSDNSGAGDRSFHDEELLQF